MLWSEVPSNEVPLYVADENLRLTLLRFHATQAERDAFIDSISDANIKASFQSAWQNFLDKEAERAAERARRMPPPPPT